MQKISLTIQYLLTAFVVIVFLLVATPKIFFPYEAHYMEGSMMNGISRIHSGLPLYTKPGIHYIPWLYQPLYYYVTAAITWCTGLTFTTARLTSVFSTIGICWILYAVVKKETGKCSYSIASLSLFIAAYPKTEFCLVMVRIDPLFTLLLVSAIITVYYYRSTSGVISGAILMGLCYFTKQTGLLFAPQVIFYLWYFRGGNTVIKFSLTLIAVIFFGTLLLNSYYEGWYSYYTFFIPRGKGNMLRWAYAVDGFVVYIIMRCWLPTTLLSIVSLTSFFSKQGRFAERTSLYFGLFFFTALIAGFIGILNSGGAHNVLLPAAVSCGLFIPIIAYELAANPRLVKISQWIVPIQLAFLASFPWQEPFNITREVTKKRQEEYLRYAKSLPGDVWIPFHGYTETYTKKREYAVIDQMRDAFLTNDSTANQFRFELDSAYSHKHWSWILSDFFEAYPHYTFVEAIRNINKIDRNDTILFYLYRPEK